MASLRDEASNRGSYYNLNRYYDADSGQYLSPDPIGFAGGLRPQGYVDNPLGFVDPSGKTAPEGMVRAHGHHIVFQKGPKAAKKYIEDSQRILKEAGIHPKYGAENLVWTPNKNHSIAAAKKVNSML